MEQPQVALDNLELGGKVAAWGGADETLKPFAHMAVAAQVGCSWFLRGRPPGELERPGTRGGSSGIVGFAPCPPFPRYTRMGALLQGP